MKIPLFMALLALAVTAFAQQSEPTLPAPARIIDGKQNPEAIPEWLALQGVLVSVVKLDERYPDGAAKAARFLGISEESAKEVIAFERARQAAFKSDTSFNDTVCAKREQLTTKEALAKEMEAFERSTEQRAKENTEAVYAILTPEEVAKVKERALAQRQYSRLMSMETPDVEPARFLDTACGEQP